MGAWVLGLIITAIAISPGLRGGFFFDDVSNIVKNNSIQIEELTLDSLNQSLDGPKAGPLGRPVSVLSFALTHFFFGLDPFSFKLINLIIHLCNGLLVGWLVRLVLESPKASTSTELRKWLPIWISVAWLVHPINILPVLLVVQRMTLLATMFLLLALISHLKAMPTESRTRWFWLCLSWLVFWPLSLFSKETGLLFPLYAGVISYFLLEQKRKNLILWILFSLLLAIALIAINYLGKDWITEAYKVRTFSLIERVMTEARVVWFYASQIIAPRYSEFAIFLDDIAISQSFFQPITTLFAILGWIAVLLGIYCWRNRAPIISMGAAWFLVGHTLESSFLPLELAHEYRNYMPGIGLVLGVGFQAGLALQKLRMDHRRSFTLLLAIVPLLVFGLFTWMRADQLKNPILGAQVEASRHPLSSRANYAAAQSLFQAGYGDMNNPIGGQQISYYFLEASKLNPSFKHGYLGLIVWSCASGRQVDLEWVTELAVRIGGTRFSPGERNLPQDLLNHWMQLPNCLTREQAILLFQSGAENPNLDVLLKRDFYMTAAAYELQVSGNPQSGEEFKLRAQSLMAQSINK